jgi:hypothetical protein
MRGRVLQVMRSARGSTVFIVKTPAPHLAGRGRFFGHISECDATYKDPQPGDLVEFQTKAPNKEHQLPKAVSVRKVSR